MAFFAISLYRTLQNLAILQLRFGFYLNVLHNSLSNTKLAEYKCLLQVFIYIKFCIQFSLHLFDNLHNFFNTRHIAACHNFTVDNKRR